MLAVTDCSDFYPGEICDETDYRVKAAITWAGITDFENAANEGQWTVPWLGETPKVLEKLFGCPYNPPDDPGSCPQTYVDYSPISYVTSDDAPVLLFNHKRDNFVPYDQSERFYEALIRNLVTADLMETQYGTPDWYHEGYSMDPQIGIIALKFLQQHLQ